MSRRESGRLVLGLAISLIALALVVRGLDWSTLVQAMREADYLWLVPAAFLILVGLLLRAVRWQLLFFPPRALSVGSLLDAINIGYLVSNLFPARLGDLVRAYLIGEWEGVGKASALSTVASERFLDVLTVILFMFLLLPVLQLPDWALRSGSVIGLSLFLAMSVLLWLARRQHDVQRRSSAVLLRLRVPRAERWATRLTALLDSFVALRDPAIGIRVACWSLVMWLNAALAFYLVFRAFHLAVPAVAAVFTLSVIALGMGVPAAPGQIGIFEATGVVALAVFGVERSQALSVVLVLHALNYGLTNAAGLWSLLRRGLSYREIVQQVR